MSDPKVPRLGGDEDGFLRLPIARKATFQPDAMISGEPPIRAIHLVMEGTVRMSLLARDGRERVMLYLTRGSIFGEQQALAEEDGPTISSSTVAFADTTCVIGYIDPSELMAAVQREPDLLKVLLRTTHLKKVLLVEELARAVFQNARSQVAALLSALSHESREPGVVSISQERLARLSGRTRVTVAAQLHYLESVGAIRLERSRIAILDPERLAALAEE